MSTENSPVDRFNLLKTDPFVLNVAQKLTACRHQGTPNCMHFPTSKITKPWTNTSERDEIIMIPAKVMNNQYYKTGLVNE